MASFEVNLNMIIEILSHSPSSIIQKFRTLNKQCNERTYNSSFIKLITQRTNSVSGYFLECHERRKVHTAFLDLGGDSDSHVSKITLDFLPLGRVTIEACDASHEIFLCINDLPIRGRGDQYIICKPTTKQYRFIPKPKIRYFTVASGLMVIGTNSLRYKILRLSQLPSKKKKKYDFNFSLVCEILDSDSFVWKRLNNVELPSEDLLSSRLSKPVTSCGFLHWLTANNNVFQFCFKTETWSLFPILEDLAIDRSLILAKYEGKLGVISSRSKEGVDSHEIWVLENSLGNSWVNVKEIKNIGLKPVGLSSNDVMTFADMDQICLYNMSNGKFQNFQSRDPNFRPSYYSTMSYFPLYSDHERVEFSSKTRHHTYKDEKN